MKMASIMDVVEIPRRLMVLFFVIDSSGSMKGSKIGAVNSAIENIIPEIQKISDSNAQAEIKIALLEFSSGARWMTENGPVSLDQFRWNDIDAEGVTDLGAACKELNAKLSTKAFLKEATGSYAPVIFLLSDGEPTDDWKNVLETLKQNRWFQVAWKFAVAIGEEANKEILKEFTGNMEAVLETNRAEVLKKMIQFVSVRASKVASSSSNVGDSPDDVPDDPDDKGGAIVGIIDVLGGDIAAMPDNQKGDFL
jgi:uncharacterized protein YegL